MRLATFDGTWVWYPPSQIMWRRAMRSRRMTSWWSWDSMMLRDGVAGDHLMHHTKIRYVATSRCERHWGKEACWFSYIWRTLLWVVHYADASSCKYWWLACFLLALVRSSWRLLDIRGSGCCAWSWRLLMFVLEIIVGKVGRSERSRKCALVNMGKDWS